jgi:hypothetical protein
MGHYAVLEFLFTCFKHNKLEIIDSGGRNRALGIVRFLLL